MAAAGPIHFGISSELFFFLAAGLNAALYVAGLCQLSVQVLYPPRCLPACPSPASLAPLSTYPSIFAATHSKRKHASSPEDNNSITSLNYKTKQYMLTEIKGIVHSKSNLTNLPLILMSMRL